MRGLRIFVRILIIQYLVFNPGWDFLHTHIHREVEVTHFEKDEASTCHRSIFHGESDDHQGHIVQYEHCSSCHVAPHPVALVCSVGGEILRPDLMRVSTCSNDRLTSARQDHEPSRGPPTIV